MLLQVALLLVASIMPAQSPAAAKDRSPVPYEDADAYEVYSAILPSEWPMRVAKAKRLVIRGATVNYEMCLGPEKGWEEVIGPAISDYVKLNEKTWLLQQKFGLGIPYELLSAEELKSDLAEGGWEGFYKLHPDSGGWVELSAVGFNADETVAVAYAGHNCGMLCGGGSFHVLQKKGDKWLPLNWRGTSCSWNS